MKSIYIIIMLFISMHLMQAQGKFITKQGNISFFSHTPIEDIKAENEQVLSILDAKDGAIGIAILMKSFMFEKSLMQEHFNENYVESDKFPKATFKGKIENFSAIVKEETSVTIKGDITIHGVTKEKEIQATLIKKDDVITLKGEFSIFIADFNINIPSVVAGNIAKEISINFELDHKPY